MYVVAQEQPQVRAKFIRKTYAHLAGAVGTFIAIETFVLYLIAPSYLIRLQELKALLAIVYQSNIAYIETN